MPSLVKIAGVQMDVAFADKEKNLAAFESKLQETHRAGARLTVFPECALTGYCFESLEEARPFAEPIPGPATQRMSELCRKLDTYCVFGLLEADGNRVFNNCTLVGPTGVIGSYRKAHLPFLGIDRFTTPGDRPFAVDPAGEIRVGMNICYDGSFPETARVMAILGADLVVLPTNWPPGAECMSDSVIATRAMENNIYYLAVDRVGDERGFHFIGKSKACAPNGAVIASADHDHEEIIYAEIDPARARNKHVVRVPELHEINRFGDRRPDLYGPIIEPVRVQNPRREPS